jgi:hypothetical protein
MVGEEDEVGEVGGVIVVEIAGEPGGVVLAVVIGQCDEVGEVDGAVVVGVAEVAAVEGDEVGGGAGVEGVGEVVGDGGEG